MSPSQQPTNHVVRLYRAAGYSIAGLSSAFRGEQAFRLETYLTVVLVPLAVKMANTPIECILLIGSWVLVMIVELLNSAIEAAIDRIGIERHELSGRAKDMGSAAVMMSVLLSLSIWLTILLL